MRCETEYTNFWTRFSLALGRKLAHRAFPTGDEEPESLGIRNKKVWSKRRT